MQITNTQLHVLSNLDRVVLGYNRQGRLIAHLDGVRCIEQINSLGARGLIKQVAPEKVVKTDVTP